MSSRLHFFRRNDALFWRRRLPRPVAEIYQRTHVCRSLKTSDRRLARRRALQLSIGFETIMEQAEQAIAAGRPPTKADLNRALQMLFDRVMAECDEWLATRPPLIECRRYASEDEFHADVERLYDDLMKPETRRWDWQDAFDGSVYEEAEKRLLPILADLGISIDPASTEFKVLCVRGMRVGMEAFARFERIYRGQELDDDLKLLIDKRLDQDPVVVPMPRPSAPVTAPSGAPISSYKDRYMEQGQHEGRWKGQTAAQTSNSIDLFIRIVGDKAVTDLKRPDAEHFRRTLEKIPKNYGKSPRHFELPITQVIAERKPETDTLAIGTLDRHWNSIVTFMRWIDRLDEMEPINVDRLFGGLRWGKAVPKQKDRLEWDDESLEKLFTSPIWTGFTPDRKRRYWRHRPGQYIVQDEYWWLPLLALYQGARLDELCQLKCEDVYDVDDIPVIHIRGPHLKTEGSERIVPVHSAILKLGFLDLVKAGGGGSIFPLMVPGGRDGKYSHFYTEHFTDYRRKIGVYRRLMDFHSFRKNATSKMIRSDADILKADEITGHDSAARKELKAMQSVTLDYWGGFSIADRRDFIEAIQYPSIDLDRLLNAVAKARPWKWR